MSDILSREPAVIERGAQPYASVSALVTMETIPSIADRLPEVLGWLAARGVEPAGPPFLRYRVIDMERQLEIEAGVPVAATPEPDGEFRCGALPPGRYVTAEHTGRPDGMIGAVDAVFAWAAERELVWDAAPDPEGTRWGCRLEVFLTDPRVEPDPERWRTELAFRLA
ncbi:GyrI-like domain-containing protein [Peterkaempfera sp. SMS 1(5)a]|uniref:GyrI-like domain-containing protein n=1 Tax=Peterkaempfera podocarpi TaxID=3232308 RepID=UPI00366C8A43